MNIHISTGQPLWFIVFCLLIAVGLSWILYRNDKALADLAKWKTWTMSVIRSIFLFILSFLLLSPLLNSIRRTIEKPIILVAQDNSESIVLNNDSIFYKNKYSESVNSFVEALETDYDIRRYSFSENIDENYSIDFAGKASNFSLLFNEINNLYANRNVGALVFASDGSYNKGSNPVIASKKLGYPVYAMALGDTSQNKDVSVLELNHNKFAFLGNNFPLQVFVGATRAKGNSTKLSVKNRGEVIFTKDINIGTNPYSDITNIEIEALNKGLQRYVVELSALDDESNQHNNEQEFVIDVIDSRQKVLILGNSPHPDIGAIRRAIESNINFEVSYSNPGEFTGNVQDFNLIIFHQLPSAKQPVSKILADIKRQKVPTFFIVGGQTDIAKINLLQAGLEINQNKNTYEDAEAFSNERFSLFEFSEDNRKIIERFPPLMVPFGNFSMNTNTDILLYQKIKGIETNKPLISFHIDGDHKTGFVAGEGLWRWRLQDYFQTSNHEIFNELINKIVQYLSLRIKKERFVVNVSTIFSETDNIIFNAEVYNKSYEPDNKPEVDIQIKDVDDKLYQYTFNKYHDSYRIDVGAFPKGDYTYTANVTYEDEVFFAEGNFSVVPVNTEALNTTANHQLMYRIATETNGKLYYPQQWDELLGELKENKSIVPVVRKEQKLTEMINLKWIFIIMMLFISIEWFLRKFYGAY